MAGKDSFKDEIAYTELYEVFSRGRIEQESMWVENKLMPRLVENFKAKFEACQSLVFEVLSVGSGIGSFDVMLLKKLLRAKDLIGNRKIRWTVVEPLSSSIERFKNTVDVRANELGNTEFVWVNKSIGEYEGELILTGAKFDFIHFVNVLFYLDEAKVLEMAYNQLLKTSGVILAVVGSLGDIWVKLLESFRDEIWSFGKEFHQPTNVDIYHKIEAHSWDVELFDGAIDLDITNMFTEGHPDGTSLLKFFLHTTEDPQKIVGKELFEDLIEFFRSQSKEKVSNCTKTYNVNVSEGVLLILKD